MNTSRSSWLGPLIVFVIIVGTAVGAALLSTRPSSAVVRVLPSSPAATPVSSGSRRLPLLQAPRPVPFPSPALRDHSFVLDGAHMATACDACHPQAIYTGTPSECASCHNDPHTDAFGQDCARCHDTVGFQLAQFDHVDAVDCHSCHSGDAPANHFPGQCSSCHSTATWVGASFAHTFPLDHGEANGKCQTCHPGDNYTAYTCYSCHNEGTIAREHREQGITDLANCVRCHPTGREEDDDED